MKKILSVFFVSVLCLIITGNSYSQNVNVSPTPVSYATLSAAFTAINAGTHGAGAITVTIVGNVTEVATADLNGGVFTSCTITPSGARTVTGNFNASVIRLNGADNVTINGLNTGGNSLNIINPNAGTNANAVECANGATNNVFRNFTVTCLGASGSTAGGRGFNIGQSTAGSGGNNNNLIESCVINGGRRGIQTFGTAGVYLNTGTIIRNNKIKNSTSLYIFVGSETSDNLVEGNEIFTDAAVANDPAGARCINIQGCGNNYVRRNWIHDITGTVAGGYIGIITIPIIFTAPIVTPATTIEISNNMVAMNNCPSSATFIYGIFPTSNTSTTAYTSNVYYNSIRIGGSSGATAGALTICLEQGQDGTHGAEATNIFNNISRNDRTGGDLTSLHLGQDLNPAANVTLSSDYNLTASTDTTVRGWDAGYNGSVYRNLGGMELMQDSACADNIDQNTVFTYPDFVSTTDLHLVAANVYGNMDAQSTGLVTTDFDGQSRAITGTNLFSYRGCDEITTGKKSYEVDFKFQETIAYPNRVVVWLLNSASPYAIYDGVFMKVHEWLGGNVAKVKLNFGPAVSGSYYLEVNTKHSVRTQSANPVSFAAATGTYNFTTALTQAYGANQSGSIAPYEMYNGDVNQDDIIDGADGSDIDNDGANFVGGCYIRTDVNDDGIVDGSDGSIVDNNASNFVGAVLLPGTDSSKPEIANNNSRGVVSKTIDIRKNVIKNITE